MNTQKSKWLVGAVVAGLAVASIVGWRVSSEGPVAADVSSEMVSLSGAPQGTSADSINATGPLVPRAVWHKARRGDVGRDAAGDFYRHP